MKDSEIFNLLQQTINISDDDVTDFRPCSGFYADYGIPTISDAIMVKLKGNGSMIYIPDKDTKGDLVKRESHKDLRAKVVMYDGVLQGVLVTPDIKAAGLKLDIVDADSEYDTQQMVYDELSEPDMELVDVAARHPKESGESYAGNKS